jgi:hypothetical protein
MKVFILIWCKNPANANNSLLTFRTLRTGFPSSEVVVYDNASIIGEQTKRLCQEVGAQYFRFEKEIRHHAYLKLILLNEPNAILVDPDIIFWEQVEHWDFSHYLIAGRLIPNFYDHYTRCHTVSRLHSSLMWLPDLKQLRSHFPEKQHVTSIPLRTKQPLWVPSGFFGIRWQASIICLKSNRIALANVN